MGQWNDDVQTWLSCPTPDTTPSGRIWQAVMSLYRKDASEADDDIICPYAWAKPINMLNCDFIFPKALDLPPYNHLTLHPEIQLPGAADLSPKSEVDSEDRYRADSKGGSGPYLELDTPEYAGKVRSELVVEKLIAQGGIRLAGVLNWLFADLDQTSGGLWVEGA